MQCKPVLSLSFLDIYDHGISYDTIKSAVVTGTTISCSLGWRYVPVLSPSFLDIYGHGTLCGTIMSAVTTSTTISCSLGWWYEPVSSLSFLLWAWYSMWHQCSGHRHNHFLKLWQQAVQASAQSVFLRYLQSWYII